MTEPLRVGLAGLGTVGAAVVRLLDEKASELSRQCQRQIVLNGVCARDRSRHRGVDFSAARWFDDPNELAQWDGIDVFVELMGGQDDPALSSVRHALSAGTHVVTANKAMLAFHGVELATVAEETGVLLNFEAAVAGGIPVVKTMREALAGNEVVRLYGIMNGTSNYILTRMGDEEIAFDEVLRQAQELGYAEADPSFDIDGDDTAHKLAILTSMAFGTQIAPDAIFMEGISNISLADIHAADELGYHIKLLGVAQRTAGGIEQRVHPTMVPKDSQIAQVHGVTNAVAIQTDLLGTLMMSGPGAGGEATASAVIGDLADIAKSRPGRQDVPALGRPAAKLKPYDRAPMREHQGGYFIRLQARDEVGVFASIASRFAQEGISLQSIVQRSDDETDQPDEKTIVLITHATTEAAVRKVFDAISEDQFLRAAPQLIRIEPTH